MSPRAQQEALERLCGWRPSEYPEEIGYRHSPPAYLKDLTEIRKVIDEHLPHRDRVKFVHEVLCRTVWSKNPCTDESAIREALLFATADQLAEALLRTLGLWKK